MGRERDMLIRYAFETLLEHVECGEAASIALAKEKDGILASNNLSDVSAYVSEYGLQHLVLKSWLHTLTYVRNLCAHHARLWDKVLQISPRLPERKNWQRMRGLEKSVFAVALA